MRKLIGSILFLLISLTSFSQKDSLFFTNGTVLLGKMISTQNNSIVFTAPSNVKFTVNEKQVRQIVLANGQELNFTEKTGLFAKRSEEKIIRRYPETGKEFIIKNNSDTIACKLVEITENEVRYSVANTGDEIFFSNRKNDIRAVVFSDGQQLALNPGSMGFVATDNKAQKLRENAFKINIVPVLIDGNYPEFIYERALKSDFSMELTAAMLNPATSTFLENNNNDQRTTSKRGYNFSFGPKFYLQKQPEFQRFKGAYVQTEFFFSSIVYKESLSINHLGKTFESKSKSESEYKSIALALSLNIGYHFNIANTLAVDAKMVLGLANVSNNANDFEDTERQYDRSAWQIDGEESGIAPMLKATFAIGIIR